MQLLASAEVMRGYDRIAIRSFAIPGLVLMENAGRAFVDELAARAGMLAGRRVAVVCGKGNNGGDGFVIARHLVNRGCDVVVLLAGKKSAVRGDAQTHLRSVVALARSKDVSLTIVEVSRARQFKAGRDAVIIVDALLGTGFAGEVRGIVRDAVEWINAQETFVAAVDIPSGIDASTGACGGVAVRAHLTVAMGLAKIGHFVGMGAEVSGQVRVVDISLPPPVPVSPAESVFLVAASDIAPRLPVRPRTSHKYSVGKVLLVGGSRSFTGAPLLAAAGAMRSGAGAVVLAIPVSIRDSVARRVTEVILLPVAETETGGISRAALPAIMERAEWADVVAVGPGLGRDEETMEVVRTLVVGCRKPIVIDADALYALRGAPEILRKRKYPTILTPHAGEFAALTGRDAAEVEADRVEAPRAAAKALKSTIVLKGAPTVTAVPGGPVYINSTGNPGMATIGSGDVLTGLVAGFQAQGMDEASAAFAAVFVHGAAGDIAAARLGERSLMATDIVDALPSAISPTGR
jgi:ADP-dependent NAD(P)H-hydrate dehydratase / NAD(P)H-hydrate epimerase